MSEFPCPHCRGASAHSPLCLTRLEAQLSKFITPEMVFKQQESRKRIRERNARLLGHEPTEQDQPDGSA